VPESPEAGQAPEQSDSSPDAGQASAPSQPTIVPRISSSQATASATDFVASNFSGAKVTGAGGVEEHASEGKLYFKVTLYVSEGPGEPNSTNVWVDATGAGAVVTAVEGGGLSYRDAALVSPASASQAAVVALGGGTVTATSLHASKWPYYDVKVTMTSGAKEKVWVSAATGVVTRYKTS